MAEGWQAYKKIRGEDAYVNGAGQRLTGREMRELMRPTPEEQAEHDRETERWVSEKWAAHLMAESGVHQDSNKLRRRKRFRELMSDLRGSDRDRKMAAKEELGLNAGLGLDYAVGDSPSF